MYSSEILVFADERTRKNTTNLYGPNKTGTLEAKHSREWSDIA